MWETSDSVNSNNRITNVPQVQALLAAADAFKTDDKLHLRNLINDSARCGELIATHITDAGKRRLIVDYSRQQVTGETMELLYELADALQFTNKRQSLQCGQEINTTEKRPVLYHVLRMPKDYNYESIGLTDGLTLLKEVHTTLDHIKEYTNKVRAGRLVGITGRRFKNFICVGSGGTSIGPEFVYEALRPDAKASIASKGRTIQFLSNIDPIQFNLITKNLDPSETLVIISSKSFTNTNDDTMINARAMKKWLLDGLVNKNTTNNNKADFEKQIIRKHMVAITSSHIQKVIEFGIHLDNTFQVWDCISERFSVTSAFGLVPLSLIYSYDIMAEILCGAHDIDEHFFNTPLRDNIPIIVGLLGIWNSTFLGYECRALLPYSESLRKFPTFVQHLDMESNGKSVNGIDGSTLDYRTGEINFGYVGSTGQNLFFQFLHQSQRVIPADFIGFMESQIESSSSDNNSSNSSSNNSDSSYNYVSTNQHDELMSHFFAQPDALAYGKTIQDVIQEGVENELREHKVSTGNRPSISMLLTKLDPFSIGQLVAIYEHRTVIQGFIWSINSFDKYGNEYGKVLAKQVRTQLSVSRTTPNASVQGFNSSTSNLLESYLAHSNNRK